MINACGADGRNAFLTLLHDVSPAVRLVAADQLVEGEPDLAVPVLEELVRNAGGSTAAFAGMTLRILHRPVPRLRSVA